MYCECARTIHECPLIAVTERQEREGTAGMWRLKGHEVLWVTTEKNREAGMDKQRQLCNASRRQP